MNPNDQRRRPVAAFPRAICAIVIAGAMALAPAAPANAQGADIRDLSFQVMFGAPQERDAAARQLALLSRRDAIAVLVLAARFRSGEKAVFDALSVLTGNPIGSWSDAMEWQQSHDEVVPHPSYREIKLQVFRGLDPNFLRFVGGERSLPENMDIRFEEITWGGVRVDGIPSLDNPKLIAANEADYLLDGDLVFGVDINGDQRAYPLRIMGWHEMFNDVIGGVPLALAYCTLCGSGILFETQVEGREKPLVFGSSGFLYRSNKLMFDRETDSLWNQFTGEPVTGPLRGTGIKLKIRPVVITSWGRWKAGNPQTKVLSLETGHTRDYGSGVVYKDYFASPDLMFPVVVGDESRLKRKDYVFGIRDVGVSKAWPLDAFAGGMVINDSIGARNLVLIGDEATRTVRAYERADNSFSAAGDGELRTGAGTWRITETALVGPDGTRLARVSGHIAYWFAWDSYLGAKSELYDR